jgi:hypothetical protein
VCLPLSFIRCKNQRPKDAEFKWKTVSHKLDNSSPNWRYYPSLMHFLYIQLFLMYCSFQNKYLNFRVDFYFGHYIFLTLKKYSVFIILRIPIFQVRIRVFELVVPT